MIPESVLRCFRESFHFWGYLTFCRMISLQRSDFQIFVDIFIDMEAGERIVADWSGRRASLPGQPTNPTCANISVSDRTQPSSQDKRSRDAALKIMPDLEFYILTRPIYYGDDFPLIIPYTTWL